MAPIRLLDTVGRYGSAGVRGLYDGNYTVPEGGLIEGDLKAFGEGIGQRVADAEMGFAYRMIEEENAILKNEPFSNRAKLIRQRLGMPEPIKPPVQPQPPVQSAPQQNLTWPAVRY